MRDREKGRGGKRGEEKKDFARELCVLHRRRKKGRGCVSCNFRKRERLSAIFLPRTRRAHFSVSTDLVREFGRAKEPGTICIVKVS